MVRARHEGELGEPTNEGPFRRDFIEHLANDCTPGEQDTRPKLIVEQKRDIYVPQGWFALVGDLKVHGRPAPDGVRWVRPARDSKTHEPEPPRPPSIRPRREGDGRVTGIAFEILRDHIAWVSGREDLSARECERAVAQVLDCRHVMADKNHGTSLASHLAHPSQALPLE